MKPVLLVVDDERNTREGLEKALAPSGYEVILAGNASEALTALENRRIDLVLSDLRMPGLNGIQLARKIKGMQPDTIIILLTAYGTVESAVEAMKEGAYDFLMKPVNIDKLEMIVGRALANRDMARENELLRDELRNRYGIENIIGKSAVMQRVLEALRQIAPTKATVLIEGESGTGKELIARAIHGLSERRSHPFVAVHCAALARELLESELFGHERGAFTGAVKRRLGRFELANGGTLFLDEVSEMNLETQVKLLRVLQEKEFERVGGAQTIRVDVRLLAATNADLEDLIRAGKFREDLYYRLNVVRITVPPLRERKGDVPLLVEAFLKEFNEANGKRISGVTAEAMNILSGYTWPGNVRELRNCIEGAVILSRGREITPADLPYKIREGEGKLPVGDKGGPGAGGDAAAAGDGATIEDVERRMIEDALKKTNGKKTEAAKLLGISRRTIHRKIKKYGLIG